MKNVKVKLVEKKVGGGANTKKKQVSKRTDPDFCFWPSRIHFLIKESIWNKIKRDLY